MMQNSSWFYEEEGQMSGPYTSKQILDFILAGKVKVETKIYNPEADSWHIAADVIPHLELESTKMLSKAQAAKPKLSGSWSPPPRPKDFKDVHIVDIVANNNTSQIDYFELISSNNKKGKPGKSPRVITGSIDWSEDLATATAAFQKVSMLLKEHRRAFTTAAALAIVFAGSYFTVSSMSENKRVPAATGAGNPSSFSERSTSARVPSQPTTPVKPQETTASEGMRMQSTSTIGSGTHQIRRQGGGVGSSPQAVQTTTNDNSSQNNAPTNAQTDTPSTESNAGNTPLYYSTTNSDAVAERDVATIQEAMNPSMEDPGAPSAAAVTPPAFADPAQDPNLAPAQEMQGDPNTGQGF